MRRRFSSSCVIVAVVALAACHDQGVAGNTTDVKEEQNYIVNGDTAPVGRYPYVATLQSATRHECGGVLVAPDIVVSAAHCIDNGIFEVRLGRRSLSDPDLEKFAVVTKVPHPGYSPSSDSYDIALLKLHKSSTIRPVQMNSDPLVPRHDTDDMTVMGWGSDGTGLYPDILRETVVQYVPNNVCKSAGAGDPASWYEPWLYDDMLCALGDGKDACAGDSGGPLIVKGDTSANDLLVGTVSWGILCAVYPGVYARVSYSYEWLESTICELSSDPPAYFECAASTPVPTPQPTRQPTPVPTAPVPTTAPLTPQPSLRPTVAVTAVPTPIPTVASIPDPTFAPSPIPSEGPTLISPSESPTFLSGNAAFESTGAPSSTVGRKSDGGPMSIAPSLMMDSTSDSTSLVRGNASIAMCAISIAALLFS